MRNLDIGLDFLTLTEYSAAEQVEAAARHGISKLNMLLTPFDRLPYFHLTGDTAARRETRRRCRDLGVEVEAVEALVAAPNTDPQNYRPVLESGAYLGARWVNMLPRDDDHSRMADCYAKTAELAASYGMGVYLEFHRRAALRSIDECAAFLRTYGLDMIKLEVDALHFFRFDGDVSKIANNRSLIARAQICDGPAHVPESEQAEEAHGHRLPPGEGQFALQAFVDALPDGITVGIEVPHRHYGPEERLSRSLSATKALISRSCESTPTPFPVLA